MLRLTKATKYYLVRNLGRLPVLDCLPDEDWRFIAGRILPALDIMREIRGGMRGDLLHENLRLRGEMRLLKRLLLDYIEEAGKGG